MRVNIRRAARPDEVVAISGERRLHFSRTTDGVDMGYIVDGEGKRYKDKPILSILVRGYWEAPEDELPVAAVKALEDLQSVIESKERRVRTQAGVRRFKLPINSIIGFTGTQQGMTDATTWDDLPEWVRTLGSGSQATKFDPAAWDVVATTLVELQRIVEKE